jgi:calmodulin
MERGNDDGMQENENEAKECFAMFDEDSDGYIKKSQLTLLLMSLGTNPTQREMKEILSNMTFKKRDKVSVSEFLYILRKTSGKSKKKPGDEMIQGLKVYDDLMSSKPGDGSITKKELQHIMTKFGEKLNKEEMKSLMEFAGDASSSGNVDYAKFVDKLVNPHKYKNK